jgi:hypothetical protein
VHFFHPLPLFAGNDGFADSSQVFQRFVDAGEDLQLVSELGTPLFRRLLTNSNQRL